MKTYVELFTVFMKIGSLTFGGGIAMLPMLEQEIVKNKKWATEDEILDYYAIGQCTPGIIAVNLATFIGYKRNNVLGAIVATLGMIFPSLVIILTIAFFLEPYLEIEIVKSAFAGIRVGVAVIILNAIVGLWKKGIKDIFSFFLFACVFIAVAFFKVSPVWIVCVAIVIGVMQTRMERSNE